jgi:AraC-like DNA-binding protein
MDHLNMYRNNKISDDPVTIEQVPQLYCIMLKIQVFPSEYISEMNYISSSLYRKVIRHALSEGMTVQDFIDLPFPVDILNQIKAVPADSFFALHERLDDELGPGFAVRVGQQMVLEDYGVLGLSWKTCLKAGEIFERSERYFKLLSDTYVFQVVKEEDVSTVLLLRDTYRRGVELSNEATLSATVVVLKAMTEKDIFPISVTFRHGPPTDLTSYYEAFGCTALFNQTHYSITYRTADFETRTAKADTSINRFLLERVDEETNGVEISPGKIAHDLQQLIKEALPSGIPSIDQVGSHMGMSARTLTRRLSESGLSFRDLIKKTQQDISKDLLKDPARNMGEIAFHTGFSEQSAFNRAFKRWTGQSPTEFRKTM